MKTILKFILIIPFLLPAAATAQTGKCLSGDCFKGKGKYEYADGSIYEGTFKMGVASGKGTLKFKDGSTYEGDLLPRYEDPGGHGLGVKAPGGTIIRTNIDGSVVERVAGGVRNAYDLVQMRSESLISRDPPTECVGIPAQDDQLFGVINCQ